MKGISAFFITIVAGGLLSCSQQAVVEYVPQIENTNYREVAMWFANPHLRENWQGQLDTMLGQMDIDTYLLSPRGFSLEDSSFFESYRSILSQASQKGVQIGLECPRYLGELPHQQVIFDGQGVLDGAGNGSVWVNGWGIRSDRPIAARVYRAYSMLKRGEGWYESGSLRDITAYAALSVPDASHPEQVRVDIRTDNPYIAGRPVMVMAVYDYAYPDMFVMSESFRRSLERFGDIPFQAASIDEFSYMRLVPPWQIGERKYRGRYYSAAMDSAFQQTYRTDMAATLLAMRVAPENHPQVRVAATNRYMRLMREGVQQAQAGFYDAVKQKFGPDAWIGWHPTYHNQLGGDELWCTGACWWSAKRDYAQTDEWTPLPTQLGILYANPARVIYNMFYDPGEDLLYEKVLTDLGNNIRTVYHAVDDYKAQYGVDFKAPGQIPQLNRMVQAARLLNRFDPDKPEVRLLVLFGMESLCNWWPDSSQRTPYDMRKLEIEQKCVALQDAGYLNALVPADLIREGRLTLSPKGKPQLGGHEFDALILLYPEYADAATIRFVDRYLDYGGKLMLEGEMTRDFAGDYVRDRYLRWKERAAVVGFSVDRMSELGMKPLRERGLTRHIDGSLVLTDYSSVKNGQPLHFEVKAGKNVYSGAYIGLLAIQPTGNGVSKLASIGLKSLSRNGKELLRFEHPVALYGEREAGKFVLRIVDTQGEKPVPTINRL